MITVFVSPELAPHLQHLGLFHVNNISGSFFLTCSKIKDDPHFLILVVDSDLRCHGVEFSYELQIPYHYVLYVYSGPDKVQNKILGFHNNQQAADTPNDAPC